MNDRYFAQTPISGGCVTLSGAEAHHLIHVMRARPGDRVVLFDGTGAEFEARIDRIGRTEAQLTVLARREVDRELPWELILGVPFPKGDRQRWLVEKAVELGVGRLVPLVSSRSVGRVGPGTLARLRRTVIEASKQCGRNRLMEIADPRPWPQLVADTEAAPRRLLAHPRGSESPTLASMAGGRPERVSGAAVLAVGPEGGFTPAEVALATSAGWELVDLGPRVLRVETAAVLLVALVVLTARTRPQGGATGRGG
jgi:16S rRNA (uracil1498-N3)-methyltransferase